MPALGATDPNDIQAQARRELGFTRKLKQTRKVAPHPRKGGTGYPTWFRLEEIERHLNRQPTTASASSISKWLRRIFAYRQTGNGDRTQILGIELIDLAIFIIAHPDETIDEIAVYIHNEGRGLYSTTLI